ncbi:hypothetical protein SAMN04490220_6170 [Rhodococcus jostii]|uniref:Uncharacterized protein n=1 Tax=Rhodococcus jostii TaxID=132919 RepID=A0A1H5EXB7_RHOJO|nr:hypothetical protein SAMN04490220_6170 [Rhodococcus jostii]
MPFDRNSRHSRFLLKKCEVTIRMVRIAFSYPKPVFPRLPRHRGLGPHHRDLANPQLIRTEIDKRLDSARTSNPAAKKRNVCRRYWPKANIRITRTIEAFGATDHDRRDGARMSDLRDREVYLHNQIEKLDSHLLADREAYIELASDLEVFLSHSTPRLRSPLLAIANACSGCSSKTSSSDPTRSPSGTASPRRTHHRRRSTPGRHRHGGDHTCPLPTALGRALAPAGQPVHPPRESEHTSFQLRLPGLHLPGRLARAGEATS